MTENVHIEIYIRNQKTHIFDVWGGGGGEMVKIEKQGGKRGKLSDEFEIFHANFVLNIGIERNLKTHVFDVRGLVKW